MKNNSADLVFGFVIVVFIALFAFPLVLGFLSGILGLIIKVIIFIALFIGVMAMLEYFKSNYKN